MRYIQIKRLELFLCQRPYGFGKMHASCGCHIFEFGPIGFTWLGNECYLYEYDKDKDLKEEE